MQVDLELSGAVSTEMVHSLRVEISAAGMHKTANLDTGPLKASRQASFVVKVGEAGAGGFDVTLSVQALGEGGNVLARREESFFASGDACNFFALYLSPPAHDGGPYPDAISDAGVDTTPACGPASCPGCCQPGGVCAPGTDDKQCGGTGAACVDCTPAGGTCNSGTCTNCTPQCSGKTCGTSDGCGGTCQPGSGCCAPQCAGKICGASDGCGGTCQSGSGCCTPQCVGKPCGTADGCGGTCQAGSGCCTPQCNGKDCGSSDGCGGTCLAGSGCNLCATVGDSDALLLYTFEGSGTTVTDVAGNHNGTLVGTAATRVSGKSGCGNSLSFSTSSPISYLQVADSSQWDLPVGSVDFWVRFDGTASVTEGIASRDANSQANAGHITIVRMCNGSIMVRLQDTSNTWAQCSAPVGGQTWHHVGVNFGGSGGLKLYVDGTLASRTSSIDCNSKTWACGSSTSKGIVGNDNPWTIGAESMKSNEGSNEPVAGPLNGRIDSFRISKVRRIF